MPAPQDDISQPSARNWQSFASLVALQSQNAFNDNAVRFVLLPLGTALASELGTMAKFYPHLLASFLVLPYILFSPVMGWMSDRFSKKSIINAALIMQTAVFLAIVASIHARQIWPATFGFFLLALQSTLLSPAKNGIIKELVGTARLNFANGWMEMTLIVSILAGMFVGGWWFDHTYMAGPQIPERAWEAATLPLWCLTAATLIALALGARVEHVAPRVPDARFEARLFWAHFGELRRLFQTRAMRLSAIGIMFFWIFGALAQLIIIQIANEATGGQGGMGSASSKMIACASGGVAIGAMLAAMIGRKRTELGIVPLGGLLMAMACGVVALLPPGSPAFLPGLVFVGLFSALFYVPLFAFLQELAPEEERGRLIACSNLLNNLGMILATVVQALLMKSGLSPAGQFAVLGAMSMVVAIIVLRILPDRFFRILLVPIVRWIWKIRAEGTANVPPEGGTLMVCNHVSYVDAFVLSAACPRPMRFLIFEEYYHRWWSRWFLDIFGAVPIAQKRAHGAIKSAAEAIRRGELVCIFPEGRLSDDGAIRPFHGGMELILKLAPAPVVPATLQGLWGSVFSRVDGKLFARWPRRRHPVRVVFGCPMPADTPAAGAEAKVRAMHAEAERAH